MVRAGLDSAEEVGECVALIAFSRWALATEIPAVTDAPLLADAGLVLKEQADPFAGMCIGNRLQAVTEPP